MDTEMGEKNRSQWQKKNKTNTWQREKCTRSKEKKRKKKQLLLITERKSCYIWFHGCKLDCIHVAIAYAIR